MSSELQAGPIVQIILARRVEGAAREKELGLAWFWGSRLFFKVIPN